MALTFVPNKIKAALAGKCPRCRKGNMFNQASVFPLKTMLDMPERCAVCNQKMELETGFYFGTGYVSYGMSVAFMISWFVAYGVVLGITLKDNSVLIALFSGIGAIVLIQPWIMRLSRSLYLRMFVKYDPETQSL
jgi:uncharacterized protein (DUF983 family)